MKKFVLILTSLFAIISCGGGGGSSGGSNTNNPTPTNPSKPPHNINIIDDNYKTYNNEIVGAKNSSIYNKPYVRKLSNIDGGENHKFGSDGNIEWHGNFLYNRHNPQNNSETSYTGYKIKVGIIDSGFNGNYYSNLRNEVKNIIRIDNQRDSKNEIHAYIVTSLIAGKDGIAKDANIYVIDGSDRYATREVRDSVDLYEALYSKGVRIFNQSFGATEATYSNNPHNFYKSRVEESVENFYKMAVDNGALFIFSAGNNEYKTSGILATLPYWIPDLEKGWINVNGLTSKNSNREGDFSWDNLKPLAGAGAAKNWTITTTADYFIEVDGQKKVYSGTSYSAPRVTATAALINEKYPFMTGDLLRQTILSTATDIGDEGVDDVYGWGLLNIDKALKGPALFDKRLALGDNVYITLDGSNKVYQFDNDISGDAGLVLRGSGTLILNGTSTYMGETNVGDNAYLKVKKIISPNTLSIGKTAMVEVIDSNINDIQNNGTFINNGNSVAKTLAMSTDSQMYSDINANLKVENAEVNGTVIITNNNGEYLTKNGKNFDIITGNVTGNAQIKSENGLMTVNKSKTKNLSANASRTDTVKYAKTLNADAEQLNTAKQIETALENVDINYEAGKTEAGKFGAKLQALNTATLDSMSGQIYASAQALTFEQSETINRNLSNRMLMLSESLKNNKTFGFWTAGIYSKGKIEKDGFAKGKTVVKGGQAGFDMKIKQDIILGMAVDYSKGEVKFNRYNGKSKANMTGLSIYSRKNLGNRYLAGRVGIGLADSKVERDIIVNNHYIEHSKVNHSDKIFAGYFETGYDIKNKSGDFVVTPYVTLGMDRMTRGKFFEENTNFGMNANKKTYNMPYTAVGLKTIKTFGNTNITGYLGYTHGLNKKNLDFDASYNFAPNAKFEVKGINYSRNKITAGIGVNTKIKENINWYTNYDYKHSTNNLKDNNNIVTTGIRIEF
jgi:outer membrane autotransporter barrel domain protein